MLVPFGQRQVVGVVLAEADPAASAECTVRPVAELLDQEPCLPDDLLELLLWAANYYFAAPGELIRAALPAVLHGRERHCVHLTELGRNVLVASDALLRRSDLAATPAELEVLQEVARRGDGVSRSVLQRRGRGAPVLRRLVDRGWLRESSRRRTAGKVRLDLRVSVLAHEGAPSLERAPRQAALLELLKSAGDLCCWGS